MENVFPLHDGFTVCLYQWPDDFSVLSLNASNEVVCYTCVLEKKDCEHVAYLISSKEKEYPSCLDKIFAQMGIPRSQSVSSVVSPRGVSKRKIPFKPDRHTSEILRQGGIHHCVSGFDQSSIVLKSSVECDKCQSCEGDWSTCTQRLPLITEVTSLYVLGKIIEYSSCIEHQCCFYVVEIAVCSTCHQTMPYDGERDALLNMTTCLVSHDLLRSYLHSFLNGR